MASNFTQTQRDLLNNVKQTVALADKSFNGSETKESLFVYRALNLIGSSHV